MLSKFVLSILFTAYFLTAPLMLSAGTVSDENNLSGINTKNRKAVMNIFRNSSQQKDFNIALIGALKNETTAVNKIQIILSSGTAADINNLSNNDAKKRRSAVNNLKNSVQQNDVEIALIEALKNETDAINRIQIIDVIAISGSQNSMLAIIESLNDSILEVRKEAVTKLDAFGDRQEVINALGKILENNDENEDLCLSALDVLSTKKNAEGVIEKSVNSKNKKVRDAALSSLNKAAIDGNKQAEKSLNKIEKNTKDAEIKKTIKGIKQNKK